MNNHPIGILDSGVGGLTVLQAIVHELPQEPIIYIGDSKNTPYGARSADEIYALAKGMIEFLLKKEVKLIVIACNTITVSCLDRLRSDYPDVPLVGTVPVIKTAAEATRNKRIGILSTTRTANSAYQKQLIDTFAKDCIVFNEGTDALVPLIEEGKLHSPEMEKVLSQVMEPFVKENVDVMALGCTHFPFLRQQIQKLLGSDVKLLDSGGAIARQVKRILDHNNLFFEKGEESVAIYTTGNMQIAKNLAASTIEERLVTVQQITLEYDQ